jgi:hypothetical protein
MNYMLLGAKLFAIAVLFVEIFVTAAKRDHLITNPRLRRSGWPSLNRLAIPYFPVLDYNLDG